MNDFSGNRNGRVSITRREFLGATSSLFFTVAFGGVHSDRSLAQNIGEAADLPLTAWIRLDSDNTITIYNPAAEMGQGTMTALPVIVAEEMDADWAQVLIENSPTDPDLYGNPGWFWGTPMMTVGSRAVLGYYTALRKAGAQARYVLLENAARKWEVPIKSLTTEPSIVVHKASGRRMSYGEIAAFARAPRNLPTIRDADLKPASEFRLIGRSLPRVDSPAKVDGSALYGIDVQVPGMIYAMMAQAPVNGSQPQGTNASEIKVLPGIVDVVVLEHGVAIVGKTVEAVLSVRKRLKIEWSTGAQIDSFDSKGSFESYARIAREDRGSVAPNTVKTYAAEYQNDYVYHAQMEPLNAVAAVNKAGNSAEIWAGTQFPDGAVEAAAAALGTSTDKITIHRTYLGGGFGRRSMSDYIVEAVQISKVVGRPVKLIRSREDDVRHGAFRPMTLQRLEAGVDANGDLTFWKHTLVGEGGRLLATGIQIPYYEVPNQDIVTRRVRHGVRVQYLRSVAHGYTKFAIESFINEIAAGQEVDPYQFRRRLLRNSPRELKVLDTVAEMAGWGKTRPAGRAIGIAFARRSESNAAGVAEVSLDRTSGKIRVHRFWAAIDAGVVVQPDNAIAQMEGGIVFGLSSALRERITFKKGAVQQSNFHDYEVMRMADAPEEIYVKLVVTDNPPTGIGEPGVPITGGAVANAVAALTGIRLRHMPFIPERVLDALKG